MIEAKVTLTQPGVQGRQFVAQTGGGHSFLMDDKDGATGPKPIELVAAGLAGCTAFDVINILRKKRQRVTGYEVRVEADQASQPPAVFTEVRIKHIITGVAVEPAAIEDAIRLSEEKYCSVGNMINKTAKFVTTYQVVQESPQQASATAAGHSV
jgi:putative redox protein